jgi:hypothetical protein
MTPDLAYIRAIVSHRCPELNAADLAAAFGDAAPAPAPDMALDLPPEVGDALIEALDDIGARLDRIEQSVRA